MSLENLSRSDVRVAHTELDWVRHVVVKATGEVIGAVHRDEWQGVSSWDAWDATGARIGHWWGLQRDAVSLVIQKWITVDTP